MSIVLAEENNLVTESTESARHARLVALAHQAGGFDAAEVARLGSGLQAFFDSVVEHCAKAAELQARSYSEPDALGACAAAARAVRFFGRTGALPETRSSPIGPIQDLQ